MVVRAVERERAAAERAHAPAPRGWGVRGGHDRIVGGQPTRVKKTEEDQMERTSMLLPLRGESIILPSPT